MEEEVLEEEFEEEEEELSRRDRVEAYFKKNGRKLDKKLSKGLKERMMTCSESKLNDIEYYYLKDPGKMRLTSIFLGWLGIDRFLMGDIGVGTLKFFTLGGMCIIWVIDIFKLPKRLKEENVSCIYLDILDK